MSKEKDILSIWKERIGKEARQGDKKKACDDIGCSPTTYLTALKRESFDDLKDRELEVLQALIVRLDARKEKQQKLKEQYGN